jgi:hypothetical protein
MGMSTDTPPSGHSFGIRRRRASLHDDLPLYTDRSCRGDPESIGGPGRGRELRNLISIVGGQALSDDDRRILALVDEFERRFVGQAAQPRSITETFDLAWELLAAFRADELKRIKPELVERYRTTAPNL